MKKIENYIFEILQRNTASKEEAVDLYNNSELLQYLNLKSGAIHGGVKSRRAFANWYTIYGIIHFYVKDGFERDKEKYLQFEGFQYTKIFNYMRGLYGGSKLQNHALNSRVNGEFANKIASDSAKQLILINDNRYLLNPAYLYVGDVDISTIVIEIAEKYISLLREKDNALSTVLIKLKSLSDPVEQKTTIAKLLTDDSEARIFEIVSYAILANHYKKTKIFIGYNPTQLEERYLQLYKTGRTNANDGGIDFVMKPLGRFFQVTEVDNYDKYFLDIDKVLRFPITFVVKTTQTAETIHQGLINYAETKSGGHIVIKKKYIEAIEEVITINEIKEWLQKLDGAEVGSLIDDIDTYYRLELNLDLEGL